VYLFASFTAIGFSFAIKEVKDESTKRSLSILAGMAINFFVFGISALASFLQNLLSYAMMILLPAKYQHVAVFATSAIVLALAQLHKQIYNPGVNGQDVPMNLMFNFCKVTSIVCAVSDGIKINREGLEKVNLKKREKEFAITDGIPSFVDFWAYMYFCGTSISGPWYEFKDF